jgi:UDP-2,4-diacetamido-2,4,6-trideoxy-beta-L-altropyranose hydrolase
MRCLSLAGELALRGASVSFACASIPDGLAERVEEAGHSLFRIAPVRELLVEAENWDTALVSPEAQRQDSAEAMAGAGPVDWIILDHYRLDAAWLDASGPARKLAVDDLANRPLSCDMLVDQTFGRRSSDYSALVPADCEVLAGARYAMLRPEFAAARPEALARRRRGGGVERLLISLGSTDIGGITINALESVLAAEVRCAIDVVLGTGARSLEPVRALAADNPRIRLHVDTADLVSLMLVADLAIGAPGTSSWERCCLGLPAITLILADNQRLVSKMLAEAGAVAAVDSAEQIGGAVARLIDDQAARARMIAAAAAITEGRGVQLVADAMLGAGAEARASPIALRPVESGDSSALWLWRNDPEMRAMAKTPDPIPWTDHERWFAGIVAGGDSRLFMADMAGEPAAMVRFDRREGGALVSINVDPALRGRGVGKSALIAACERYEAEACLEALVAEIRPANAASVRIFEAAGFERAASRAKEFLRFERRRRD